MIDLIYLSFFGTVGRMFFIFALAPMLNSKIELRSSDITFDSIYVVRRIIPINQISTVKFRSNYIYVEWSDGAKKNWDSIRLKPKLIKIVLEFLGDKSNSINFINLKSHKKTA